jgi:predicted type IV restriction endonuclease
MVRLKDLVETWKVICGRMDTYGTSILGANEEATRYALIDPILTALGWEIDNPKYVRVECSQDYGGKPDYTLMKNNRAVCYVEAKKWGTISSIKKLANPLDSDKFNQLKDYCISNSVGTGAFSDGGAWYIIDYSKKNPKVVAFIDAENATKTDIKKLLQISC